MDVSSGKQAPPVNFGNRAPPIHRSPKGVSQSSALTDTGAPYITLANLKTCESAFHMYMTDRFAMRFEGADELVRVRQELFTIMKEIEGRHGGDRGLTVRDKNNLVLNIMRDVVVSSAAGKGKEAGRRSGQKSVEKKTQPPRRVGNDLVMNRENELFGRRSIVQVDDRLLPSSTAASEEDTMHMMDAFDMAQQEVGKMNASNRVDEAEEGVKETAMQSDDFQRKVEDLIKERLRTHNPEDTEDTEDIGNMDLLTPLSTLPRNIKAAEGTTICKTIGLHGVNRDVAAWPQRYRFSIRASGYENADLQTAYKNVSWIEAIAVIVPMEIPAAPPSGRPFINEFDFSFPYVSLNIEGFDGAYDGTNDAIRRCFCMMIFDRSYRTMNGRGYVVLRPINRKAHQRRSFATPLASLRDLSVSITKPNGTLLNNSLDSLRIASLTYETGTGLFIRVVCNRYFDKNEFFVGDTVIFREFSASTLLALQDNEEVSQATLQLDGYINREQGHEVVKLGAQNAQGFYNDFYTLAPGVLNSMDGTLVLDEGILDAVREVSRAEPQGDALGSGRIVNMSLQPLITLGVGCDSPGAQNMPRPM